MASRERLKSEVEKSESLREYGDRPYEEFRVIIGELTEFLALEGLNEKPRQALIYSSKTKNYNRDQTIVHMYILKKTS